MTSKTDSLPAFAKTATALSILAAISSQTLAAETEQKDPLLIVITTATTTPITASESLASVTVIDKDDIEKQQPQEMTELLAGQPGVDITTNGGYGKTTSLYVRGANSSGTKLLIDGVPLQSHSLGRASWQYLPPSLVTRVETVRGPKSSLYGSSASGGVVQVFLPEAADEADANISVGGGSFNTRQADVSLSGTKGNANYLLAAGKFATDGTPIRETNAQDMGYSNTHLLAKFGYNFDSGAYLKALVMRASGESDYDSSGKINTNDFTNQVVAVTGGMDITNFWQTELQLREGRDDFDTLDDQGKQTGYFYSHSKAVKFNNVLWFGNHELVFGSVLTNDSFEGSYEMERESTGYYAQSLSQFGDLSVQLNLRADDYDEYDLQTTGGLALGYQLDGEHTVRLSGRNSFTAPNFNVLNIDPTWGYTPVGEIRPETSTSVEVGVRGDYRSTYWDFAIYQAEYEDLISWSYPNVGNIDKARVRGIEFATGAKLAQWSLGFNATLMDPVNLSDGDNHGKRLQRRVEKSARIDVDRGFENASLGFTVAGYGDRYDDPENTELLPGYALLNLRASYDFAKDWNAKFTVKNALDKDYETAGGYKNPGVGAFLTVNYSAL